MSSWDSPFLFIGIAKTPRYEALWICDKKAALRWTAPQKLDTQLIKVQFFMAKPKYSLETRLAVVNHYLAGHDGA
ncbi:hypothetical protein, partial [Salmonella enterica]